MDSNSVIQKTGLGHNINASETAEVNVGDFIISSLSSNDLVTFTKQLLRCMTHRDWKTACTYINSLKAVSPLDDECKGLLKLLEYKLNLLQNRDTHINQDLFLSLLRSSRSGAVIKDIVESIFIYHLSHMSESKARNRFLTSPHKGSFSEEVFYENLANSEDLEKRLDSGVQDLFEHELCALSRCALRCKKYQLAADIAERLNNEYPNDNSEILLSNANVYRLHHEIDGRHYWLINRDTMNELNARVDECLELAKRSSDFRVIHIAGVLLAATWFQSDDLMAICSKNIEEAEKVIPQARKLLLANTEEAGDFSSTKELLNQKHLTLSENGFIQVSTDLFNGVIQVHQVRKWLKKGWEVAAADEYTKEFIQISLKLIACTPDNKEQTSRISEQLEIFLNSSPEKLGEFNIQVIYQLCISLRRVGLPFFVVKLLEPRLPNTPWASPALDIYAEALMMSDQFGKLDTLLKKMEGAVTSPRLMSVNIESACLSDSFVRAIELIELALVKYKHSCYYWALLLRALYLSNSTHSKIESAVSNIPKEILNKYSDEGLNLIGLISRSNLSLAESVILEWFIDNPVGMAIQVTNLHFNNIERSYIPEEIIYPSDRCSMAVVYRCNNIQYTKLLVEDCGPSEHFLDTDSPLGQLFIDANADEEINLGALSYKVVEKLHPTVGAFRISLKIRDNINLGNDCFHTFQIEEDGIEGLLRQIDSLHEPNQLIEPEIDGKIIPLMMRLNNTHPNDLVSGAFIYLNDKVSNRYFSLYSEGEYIKKSVVLDVLSLAYFSMTGLSHGLMNTGVNLYITKETHRITSDWLEQMSKVDYLSIAKTESGYVKTTAKDVEKNSSINNLRALLKGTEILSPISIDMPEVLTKVRDIMDISHYSSLKASISHSIPFLCLDAQFCGFYNQLDVTTANAYQLMMDSTLANSRNKSCLAKSHIQSGLAVPLMHQDVIELCSQKEVGQYWASEILKKHPYTYPSPEVALYVLTNCCVKSVCSAFLGYKGDFYLSEWRYTEHIINACCESGMMCLKGETCEQRLALLIYQVLKILKPANNATKMALALFKTFISGHFLDIQNMDAELLILRETEANASK